MFDEMVDINQVIEEIDLSIEAYDAIEGPVDSGYDLGLVNQQLEDWSIED